MTGGNVRGRDVRENEKEGTIGQDRERENDIRVPPRMAGSRELGAGKARRDPSTIHNDEANESGYP
jgi:hypothetical protein